MCMSKTTHLQKRKLRGLKTHVNLHQKADRNDRTSTIFSTNIAQVCWAYYGYQWPIFEHCHLTKRTTPWAATQQKTWRKIGVVLFVGDLRGPCPYHIIVMNDDICIYVCMCIHVFVCRDIGCIIAQQSF